MKITEQQAIALWSLLAEAKAGSEMEVICAFLESIPTLLPTLRPIAEMPAEVPEGRVRVYAQLTSKGTYAVGTYLSVNDTHALDILLPVESAEDKWRAEFESKMKAKYPAASVSRETNGDYFSDATSYSWDGFKLAKATPETK